MELIQTEMTPKERSAAYARGEEVDRIPACLGANETGCWGLLGIPISDYYFSADIMVEVETYLAEHTGADNMGMNVGLRSVAEAMGSKMHYPKDGVAYVEEPGLDDLADVENLEVPDFRTAERFPIMIEAFERLIETFGEVRNVGSSLAAPFTTAANFYGTERLLKATRKDPEGVHRLLQYATDCVVECCRQLHEILGIGFQPAEPLGAHNVLSKRQFEDFLLPYLKQMVERLDEFQGSTSIHMCGSTHDRWDDIVSCGIRELEIDNCESLADLKEQYGDTIGVAGNLPPVDVLRDGTPADIAAGVRACVVEGADNPMGYNLCPGCTTPVGTSLENMVAFMNAATVYGRGAKKGELPKGIVEGDVLDL